MSNAKTGQYDNLDRLIVERLGNGSEFLFWLYAGAPRAEAQRIADATGRKDFRVFDGRLQALRKRGVIKFNSKTGWSKS